MAITAPLVQAPDPGGTPPKVGPGPRARILVVEDHEDSREMLRQFLQFEGYDVGVAEDGRAGSTRPSRPPVIALIDLGLPSSTDSRSPGPSETGTAAASGWSR